MNIQTPFKLAFLYLILHLFFAGCRSTDKIVDDGKDHYRFAFYNVENLFDTLNNPIKKDDEFTPGSEKEWTGKRYYVKLKRIRKVINALDNPIAMGLCEVENAAVLKDLTTRGALKDSGYDFIHYESPDMRGIDVAFIYQKNKLSILDHNKITINFPKEVIEDYTTRDILHVKAMTAEKEIIHFYVNHWPSRYGGAEESEPKRLYVASQLKKEFDKVRKANPNEGIVMLGDFNDATTNKSITNVLGAKNVKNAEIFCCHCELEKNGEGSYNFRGEWNMIDQFFVSNNLMDAGKIQYLKAGVLKEDYLFYDSKKDGKKPTRTYSGKRYFGGYSDHLPVYIDLKRN